MNKKIAFWGILASAILTNSYLSYSAHKKCIHELRKLYREKQFRAKDVILLWDLHGVLSRPSTRQVIKQVWNFPNKSNVFKALFNKKTYTTIWDLQKKGQDCSEQYATELIKNVEHLNGYSKKTAISFINAQKPLQSSISIMKRMAKQAKGSFLLSNIGQDSLNDLVAKPGYEFLKALDGTISACPANGWKAKPHPDAFTYAKKIVHQKFPRPKIMILIDDKLENVQTARKHGIYSIHFKNHRQLQRDLQNIGFI